MLWYTRAQNVCVCAFPVPFGIESKSNANMLPELEAINSKKEALLHWLVRAYALLSISTSILGPMWPFFP